jgi:hypothetical protein
MWRRRDSVVRALIDSDREGEMTIPDRVADLLRRNKPNAYCDDCICLILGLARRQEAQQATKPLSASGAFTRARGRCFNRGETHKRVIPAK